jgi:hypothetical protein
MNDHPKDWDSRPKLHLASVHYVLSLTFDREGAPASFIGFQVKPTPAVIVDGPPMTREEVIEVLSTTFPTSLFPILMVDIIMAAIGGVQQRTLVNPEALP